MNQIAELAEFLGIALRGRIETVAEIADVTGLSIEVAAGQVSRLEELGFLSVAEGIITYRRPDAPVSEVAHRLLANLITDLSESVGKTHEILGTLPKLLQSWEHGYTDVHGLRIDVAHGPFAAPDIYRLQASRAKPRASYACMPDTAPLYTVLRDRNAGSYWEKNAGPDHDIRLIVSTGDASSELGRAQVQHELNAGSQVRMHPNPPSLFWILDHSSVGIPFVWGQSWPTSMMSIESPTLAGILTWIYNRVWEEAVPVTGSDLRWENPWDPILQLMNAGLTMESASAALGWASRTGRRRVADAMRHFGVVSQFSLGAAWSASRDVSR